MIGHYIYTRAAYAYNSNQLVDGTVTAELTKGIFGQNPHQTVMKLEEGFSALEQTIAQSKHETSVLRIISPTESSKMLSRTYYVKDQLTGKKDEFGKIEGRGVVQYSYGVIFTNDDAYAFIDNPLKEDFLYTAFEPYEDVLKRSELNGEIYYPAPHDYKYLKNAGNYLNSTLSSKLKLWSDINVSEEMFTQIYTHICKAIVDGNERIAVVIGSEIKSEDLIFAVLNTLPPWLKKKFGAISRWKGNFTGEYTEALSGIHLVCYEDSVPTLGENDIYVDMRLSNGLVKGSVKRIKEVTSKEKYFAHWIFENMDNKKIQNDMANFMSQQFFDEDLESSIPFDVFADLFFMWDEFVNKKSGGHVPTFETCAWAVIKLHSSFGAEMEEFFKNKIFLNLIFSEFNKSLVALTHNELSLVEKDLIFAICDLAFSFDFKINEVSARDIARILTDKLITGIEENAVKLEELVDYYDGILNSVEPEKYNYAEKNIRFDTTHARDALRFYDRILKDENVGIRSKNLKQLSFNAFERYTNVRAIKAIKGEEKYESPEDIGNSIRNLAEVLKKHGYQLNINGNFMNNIANTRESSEAFFEIVKVSREISNITPPEPENLIRILNGLKNLPRNEQDSKIRYLLKKFWSCEDLKSVKAKNDYIRRLDEGNASKEFVKRDVGTADFSLEYQAMLNEIPNPKSVDEAPRFIRKLHDFWNKIYNTGFESADDVYKALQAKTKSVGFAEEVCAVINEQDMKKLNFLMERNRVHAHSIYKRMEEFDKIAIGVPGISQEFCETYEIWENDYACFAARMDYWIKAIGETVRCKHEWALSRVLIDYKMTQAFITDVKFAKTYLKTCAKLFKRTSFSEKEELQTLYEAMGLLFEPHGRYSSQIKGSIFKSLSDWALQIANEMLSGDEKSIAAFFETGEDFAKLKIKVPSARRSSFELGKQFHELASSVLDKNKSLKKLYGKQLLLFYGKAEKGSGGLINKIFGK